MFQKTFALLHLGWFPRVIFRSCLKGIVIVMHLLLFFWVNGHDKNFFKGKTRRIISTIRKQKKNFVLIFFWFRSFFK